jgi:hypothetical protein
MNRQACATLCTIVLGITGQLAGCSSDPVDPQPAAGTGVSGTGATSGTGASAGKSGGGGGTGGATGMAGTGGGADLSCAMADKTATPSALHAAAMAAFGLPIADSTMKGPCSFSACHDTGAKKAKLLLEGVTDLNALLVDKPSCETLTLKLVDSHGGDAALANSWLWQKLVAPANASGVLASKPEWGAGGQACMQMGTGQPFGLRMPWSNMETKLTPPEKLKAVLSWICAGAPKP